MVFLPTRRDLFPKFRAVHATNEHMYFFFAGTVLFLLLCPLSSFLLTSHLFPLNPPHFAIFKYLVCTSADHDVLSLRNSCRPLFSFSSFLDGLSPVSFQATHPKASPLFDFLNTYPPFGVETNLFSLLASYSLSLGFFSQSCFDCTSDFVRVHPSH